MSLGSDENYSLCERNRTQSQSQPSRPVQSIRPSTSSTFTTTEQPSLDSCRADNIPVNGDAYYQIDENKKRVTYGELIHSLTIINYTCIANHYLIGNTSNICIYGRWQSKVPHCEPRCSSTEIQGVTISANCFSILNNTQKSTSCVRPAEPGTIAYISCQRGYEIAGPPQTLTCRSDGRWSPTPQKCSHICGEINEGEHSFSFFHF